MSACTERKTEYYYCVSVQCTMDKVNVMHMHTSHYSVIRLNNFYGNINDIHNFINTLSFTAKAGAFFSSRRVLTMSAMTCIARTVANLQLAKQVPVLEL